MKAYSFLFCFLLGIHYGFTQNKNNLIHSLLLEIEKDQISSDGAFYKGMFPSYRNYGNNRKKPKPDKNIFFTGLIAFTLKNLEPLMDSVDRSVSKKIREKAISSYKFFQNKKGRPTYNFWQTNPPELFPGSFLMKFVRKTNALPDDLDDTSILWLSEDYQSDSSKNEVKKLMNIYANKYSKKIKNTYKEYRDLPAYSTWFGNKIPVDFDFCVECNVLYYVLQSGLPFEKSDSATVTLLAKMIKNRDYLKEPSYISPHYGRTPILLFHISRLLGRYSIPELDSLKGQIRSDIDSCLSIETNNWNKVLLAISQSWLGEKIKADISINDVGFENNSFIFFKAGLNSYMSNGLKRFLDLKAFCTYYYTCPSYNKALFLNYLMLCN